jgi:hypothetical protein
LATSLGSIEGAASFFQGRIKQSFQIYQFYSKIKLYTYIAVSLRKNFQSESMDSFKTNHDFDAFSGFRFQEEGFRTRPQFIWGRVISVKMEVYAQDFIGRR